MRFIRQLWRRLVPEFRVPLERRELLSKYAVTIGVPQGVMFLYQIGSKENAAIQYTWVLLEHSLDNTMAFIWMIYTHPRERRRGYARDMIRILQERYCELRSHYDDRTINDEGVKLLLSCGFKTQRSVIKRYPHMLVWRKEK